MTLPNNTVQPAKQNKNLGKSRLYELLKITKGQIMNEAKILILIIAIITLVGVVKNEMYVKPQYFMQSYKYVMVYTVRKGHEKNLNRFYVIN